MLSAEREDNNRNIDKKMECVSMKVIQLPQDMAH